MTVTYDLALNEAKQPAIIISGKVKGVKNYRLRFLEEGAELIDRLGLLPVVKIESIPEKILEAIQDKGVIHILLMNGGAPVEMEEVGVI